MRKHKEGDTVRAIVDFLHAHHIPAWRINSGAVKIERRFLRFGAVGMSDIIGIYAREVFAGAGLNPTRFGVLLAIEVKSRTGKVTPMQQHFLEQVTAAGGKAFVARSVDDVRRELGLP